MVSTVAGELIPRHTPQVGFEPTTNRLTVDGSAAELLRIVFFSLEFEVQFIVLLSHLIEDFIVFLETKSLSMRIATFQFRY